MFLKHSANARETKKTEEVCLADEKSALHLFTMFG